MTAGRTQSPKKPKRTGPLSYFFFLAEFVSCFKTSSSCTFFRVASFLILALIKLAKIAIKGGGL
jgi:hypothetical protein